MLHRVAEQCLDPELVGEERKPKSLLAQSLALANRFVEAQGVKNLGTVKEERVQLED